MHIVKPSWLTHGGELRDFEVYSCHVSPDGSRLVTAAGDGYVRIWSTEAIMHCGDAGYSNPKQLAAISNHSGTIHTVRFSGNGRYLASGADDKIVCVYVLDPNPPTHASTFGTNEPPPVENWRVVRRLIGHDNDVQDLGWSYDSSILVSVGLDSKIVVWSGATFEKLKTISYHQSHVKGITFDPANKYFATASDDRSIKIFRFNSPAPQATAHDQVHNFTLEKSITAPFESSPLTTYFRRCSWSPDGNHIAAANAVNGPVSSVAIINRGTWDGDINLIGHEGPVEVCAFSPRMFYKSPVGHAELDANGHSTQVSVTVVACAGQDKTLSIWNTSFARPFVVHHDIAAKAITDLAWSPDGETLFITSLDGGVTAAVFEEGELGYPAPLQENEKNLSKYGAGRKAGVIEGTDALLLEERSKAGELKGVQGRMGELMGDAGVSKPAVPTNGSIDGPRTNGAVDAQAGTNGTTQAPPVPPPAERKVNELKSRVTWVNGKKRVQPTLLSSSGPSASESSLPQTQLISATKQGVKSDSPHAVLDLSKPYDGFPKGGLASLLIGNKRKFAEVEGDEEKRNERRMGSQAQSGAPPILLNTPDGLVPPSAAIQPQDYEVPEPLRPAVSNPALSVSQVRMAIPLIRSVIVRTVDGSEPPPQASNGADVTPAQRTEGANEEVVMLEARNATGPSRTGRHQDKDPTRITCTKRGQSLWQDYLPKPVLLLTGNPKFWAASCDDGSLFVWTPAGRRLVNAMIVDATPVILDCRGWFLLCVTAVGMCHVWNMKTLSAPHPPVSLAPALDVALHVQGMHLTHAPGVVFARLNSAGRIIVAMTNGDGYSYNPQLFVWQRLCEPWWAVGSQYWNTTDAAVGNLQPSSGAQPQSSTSAAKTSPEEDNDEVSPENVSAGIIPLLERNTTNHTLVRGRAYFLQRLIKALLSAEGFEGFESCVSVAHLENRVAAALSLGAREEFKVYLLMYAKRLGAEGLKAKVEELLRSLVGDVFEGEGGDDADEEAKEMEQTLCGWKKEELLKEVVLVLGKHRDLQRTIVPYARLLDIFDKRAAVDEPQQMITDV
ncbi:TUP1-like enhancer of split-domain-containing protein [Lineolata rhizophorae]|uniref:Protein HIR n=1 Tax=Lineolata rhizophorae TaxID=578093 RepID=A0A6A6PA24_9PEZI|nr:TUP1-like enhancer of split-domain-containing protein [Lineolata rhizophorae]